MRGTLAKFKKFCQVGRKVIFTSFWCPNPTEREIVRVQSNSVAFSHPVHGPSQPCWLQYPKANEITEPEPNVFVVSEDDSTSFDLRYDFNV